MPARLRVPALLLLLAWPALGLLPAPAARGEEGRLSPAELKAAEQEFARLYAAPGNGPEKQALLGRLLEDGSARCLKLLGEALFREVEIWGRMRKDLDALATEHAEILSRSLKGFVPVDEKRVKEVQAEMAALEAAIAREAENVAAAQAATVQAPPALRQSLLRRARSAKEWHIRAAAARVAWATRAEKESWEFVSKALVGDPDGRVRLAVLDALADTPPSAAGEGEGEGEDGAAGDAPPDRAEDLLIGALGDADWGVQVRAVQLLGARRTQRAVPHLINALARATPRVAEAIGALLRELTGENFGPYPEQWGRWWEDHKDDYQEKVKVAGGKREEFPEAHFYGIPIKSDRVLFVIDISGSMKLPTENPNPKENWKPPPTTTGGNAPPPPPPPEEILSGPKIDVAKHELKKAIEKLPTQATFNIVCFNQAAVAWQPRQMPATKQNKEDAYQWIRTLSPSGSTYIDGALRLAFRLAGLAVADDKYPEVAIDTMMVLSDGAPTDNTLPDAKLMDPEEVLAHVREWNRHGRVVIHAIGISRHEGVEFMQKLARENGGIYVDR